MMKLKRKSLALMVSITCCGLLYGVNANATSSVITSAAETCNAMVDYATGGIASDQNFGAIAIDDSSVKVAEHVFGSEQLAEELKSHKAIKP